MSDPNQIIKETSQQSAQPEGAGSLPQNQSEIAATPPPHTPDSASEMSPFAEPPTPEIARPGEQPTIPEQKPTTEKRQTIEEGIDTLRKKLRRPKKKKSSIIPQVRDEITVKVEQIMEDGLADVFRELTPIQQQEFKIKGEETAFKIRQLLTSAKVKVKSIFRLILEWLKLLPGVNLFFLEQEAKIRADKIMALKEQYFPKK